MSVCGHGVDCITCEGLGQEEERLAVVTWLRDCIGRVDAGELADVIGAGGHVRKAEKLLACKKVDTAGRSGSSSDTED